MARSLEAVYTTAYAIMEHMEKLGRGWKRIPVAIRKPLILIVGSLVIIAGIILLPLPGPGWVVIFLGFAILATEFESAERIRDWAVRQFKHLIAWTKGKQQELKDANARDDELKRARKHKQQ